MKTAILLVASILLSAIDASPFSQPRTFVKENSDDVKVSDTKYRLPSQKITILRYDIIITPYFSGSNAFTFDGEVTITANATEANIPELKLHAKSLNFRSVMHGDDSLEINSIEEPYDFWTIRFKTPPSAGEFKIVIKYSGILGDDMHGFYKSSYEEESEETKNMVEKWMGTTQFQPVHARRAFPCFDEPGYKAIFKITIRRPKTFQQSLSNTVIISSTEKEDYTEDVFNETPVMSAYLIAFIVSEYKNAGLEAPNTVNQFGIWARPGAKDQGAYALETSKKLVKTLGEYVGYEFKNMGTYLKNDHVAIPDFSAGAMENWGLATYREAYLMYHPNESNARYQQQVASILSHEITHFWFGDLVTCKWWSETWLNEGFARYFQYFLTDMMEDVADQKLDMTSQFTVGQVQSVMGVDASNTSTPMTNVNTNSPAEVQGQFGTVTYNKGASVIRMVRNWLSESTFQKALKNYMNANQFKAVEQDKLFDELQKAANEDKTGQNITVKDLMSSWTDKNGYPVLKVNVDRKDAGSEVTIIQTRFMKSDQTYEDTNRLWKIPITYTTKTENNFNETNTKLILKLNETKLEEKIDAKDWIIFNLLQGAYYRVQYDNETLKLIVEALNNENNTIHTFNKAQIVDDLFNFAREGMMDYSHMFESTKFLQKIDEYSPWSAAFAGFSFLRSRFITAPSVHRLIELHLLTMMEKTLLVKLGFEEKPDDRHLTKLFRINTYNLACQLGHSDCRTRSVKMFDDFKTKNQAIKPNAREYVYCTALRFGDESDFDRLWNKYLIENVVNEKIVILNALGCSRKDSKLEKLLLSTLYQGSPIRDQDKMAAFNSVLSGNKENLDVVFSFVQNNVKYIKNSFGSGNLRSMIDSLASRMSTEQLKELNTFLDNNVNLDADDIKSGKRSIEMAEISLAWVKNNGEGIEDYLGEMYNSAGTLRVSMTLMVIMLIAVFMNK